MNDNDSKIVNANNNFIIDTWIKQVPIVFRSAFDTVPIQCAITYPSCVQDKPVGICRSNCSNVFPAFSNLRYNPCSLKIFQDDSKGQICTKIISSSGSSVITLSLILLFISIFL
jgi:hypothetical protein